MDSAVLTSSCRFLQLPTVPTTSQRNSVLTIGISQRSSVKRSNTPGYCSPSSHQPKDNISTSQSKWISEQFSIRMIGNTNVIKQFNNSFALKNVARYFPHQIQNMKCPANVSIASSFSHHAESFKANCPNTIQKAEAKNWETNSMRELVPLCCWGYCLPHAT